MLVLTRKTSETVWIGSDIEIRVTLIDGNKVRLAISAPRSIPVLRGELVAHEQPLAITATH
ncbi:MAG: carbon storage regulator [Planctomycetaceae bacterium]